MKINRESVKKVLERNRTKAEKIKAPYNRARIKAERDERETATYIAKIRRRKNA